MRPLIRYIVSLKKKIKSGTYFTAKEHVRIHFVLKQSIFVFSIFFKLQRLIDYITISALYTTKLNYHLLCIIKLCFLYSDLLPKALDIMAFLFRRRNATYLTSGNTSYMLIAALTVIIVG